MEIVNITFIISLQYHKITITILASWEGAQASVIKAFMIRVLEISIYENK